MIASGGVNRHIVRNAWIGLLLLAALSWITNREQASALVPMTCLVLGFVGALMTRHDLGATRAVGASWECAASSIAISFSLSYPCLGPLPILPLLLVVAVGYLSPAWLRLVLWTTGPEQICFLIGFLACSFLFVVVSAHHSGLEAVAFAALGLTAWPIAAVYFVVTAIGRRWFQWH